MRLTRMTISQIVTVRAKSEYRQNQFGGTIGGPVIIPKLYNGRDKTFFFFDYQGTRIIRPTPYTNSVPTTLMQNSGFTNLQELITTNSGTKIDALKRKFPYGTVLDPATTRSVAANGVDPVSGLPNPTGDTVYVRDPFVAGGASVSGVTDFTTQARGPQSASRQPLGPCCNQVALPVSGP